MTKKINHGEHGENNNSLGWNHLVLLCLTPVFPVFPVVNRL